LPCDAKISDDSWGEALVICTRGSFPRKGNIV
jgi:hypothetical protein